MFTGTDSLVYETETNDVYEDFCKNKDKFDFRKNSQNSKFYDATNKRVIGKMKGGTKDIPIIEFVGMKNDDKGDKKEK